MRAPTAALQQQKWFDLDSMRSPNAAVSHPQIAGPEPMLVYVLCLLCRDAHMQLTGRLQGMTTSAFEHLKHC